jgi:hypothetical protein
MGEVMELTLVEALDYLHLLNRLRNRETRRGGNSELSWDED